MRLWHVVELPWQSSIPPYSLIQPTLLGNRNCDGMEHGVLGVCRYKVL